MSIRTNKMKAIPVLLKQLMTARSKFHERGRDESFDGKLEKMRLDVNKIKDIFVKVKKNEEELLDILAEVYDHLRKLDRRKLDEEMDDICKRIRDSAHKLLPMDVFADSYKEEDHKGGQIFHSLEELKQPHQTSWTLKDYDELKSRSKGCLMSLLIFPENVFIRKRYAINLWIGQGLIRDKQNKTSEELGELMIKRLLDCKAIVGYGNGDGHPVNKLQILPGVRRQLESHVFKENVVHHRHYFKVSLYPPMVHHWLELERKKFTLGDWNFGNRTICTIFNTSASYLNFRPQWVNELKNVQVLQLGRWQASPLHHIEVGSEELLKELRNLTQLKYLSLRGISRIFDLPSSIVELERLLVLDLKACHNLETLPNDISSMKSLTHLILSQCYLLEGMPKGIEKLTNLQVLKGFVISTPGKTPCRISDLVNLKKLRQLSIHIGSEAVIRDMEFESLKDFLALQRFKISWSVSDPKYGNIHVILPPQLTKLHLECFPGKIFRECFLPGNQYMWHLKELNITGGKMESMEVDFEWFNVDLLRLKYLKQLSVDVDHLKSIFPRLKYVEIKQISNYSYKEEKWDF